MAWLWYDNVDLTVPCTYELTFTKHMHALTVAHEQKGTFAVNMALSELPVHLPG